MIRGRRPPNTLRVRSANISSTAPAGENGAIVSMIHGRSPDFQSPGFSRGVPDRIRAFSG